MIRCFRSPCGRKTNVMLSGRNRVNKEILKSTSSFSTANKDPRRNVVIVDGVRLPFAMTTTIYADEMAVDLQRLAFKGLMDKAALNRDEVDYIISGTVIQEVRTSNIAREAAINAGLPNVIGGHTVSMVSTQLTVCHSTIFLLERLL